MSGADRSNWRSTERPMPSGSRRRSDAGVAMAALLVSLAVASVMLSMALPAWRHAAQREREAELIFRGEQYVRAIMLYQRQTPGAFPPDLETLMAGRFLRHAYRDPMTDDGAFRLIPQSERATLGGAAAGGGIAAGPERMSAAGAARMGGSDTPDGPGGVEGGIAGVVSRSTQPSIARYNGRGRYDEWLFLVSEPADPTADTTSQ